ncbi:MAG TPA: pitrilysin family protein [Polyangiaceae bacterium]|nr:pitrilysin family protein [Polyangiaceae bacterium]
MTGRFDHGEAFRALEHRLSNGLNVVLVPRPALHQVSVALFLRVGSRFETAETNGVSHFLEHMLYRGTPSRPNAHAQALAFEGLGGTLYAATAADHGLMTLTLPPETLLEALPLLGEVVQSPVFSSIEVERRIVHEEILEDLDDDGRQVGADNLVRGLLYGEHPLGFPITGSLATLASFDVPSLRAHHARHYRAGNAVLAVAGALPEGLLPALERSLGPLPGGAAVAALAPPPPAGRPRFRYVESDGSQTDLRVAFRAVGERDPREPAAEVLLRLVDDGMSTRLYERLCDDKGLCYDVSASFEAYEDDGVFDLAAETQHARAPEVMRELLGLCAELAAEGPSDAELDKVRKRASWGTRAMLDDAEALASFYGLARLAGIAPDPARRCEEILAVTREQVRDVAGQIFRPERLAAVAVGVLGKAERARLERVVRAFGA